MLIIPTIADASLNQDFRVINGSYSVSNAVITEKLKINGEAILGENTIVKNTMIVNGKLQATKATFEAEIFFSGNIVIHDSWINNNAQFNGDIIVTNSQFSKNFSLLAQKSTYSACHFNNVIIQKNPYVNTAQIIYLTKGTIITGDLTFEAGNGEIFLDNTSQIKGMVYGARKNHETG